MASVLLSERLPPANGSAHGKGHAMSASPRRGRARTSANSADQLLRGLHALGLEAGRLLSARAPSPLLRRLAARREDRVEDRYTVLPIEDVLYVFLGSAPARGVVDATWRSRLHLRPDRVYARLDEGVFATAFRSSLEELRRRLPTHFQAVHQSVLVNLDRVSVIDTTVNKISRVGITVRDGSTEWLLASRRSFVCLRRVLGLPQRRPRRDR